MSPLDYDAGITLTGRGPAIVLIPGIDGTGRLFYRQVPRLAERHTVVTYGLRDSATSMSMLVGDLARIVDHVVPASRRAIIVGESFGGALGLSFALAHPERVAGLVVLNSFPYFAPQLRLLLAIAVLGAMPWGAMAVVRRATASRMHSRHTHRAEVSRFLQLSAGITRDGYVNRLRVLREYDVRARLREIRSPTLFLASEQDRLVPAVAQARYMAAHVPGASMQILEGHGHICLIAPGVDLAALIAPIEEQRGAGL
jgi:pimeloyl-ACP methyl ester carboxylesterase